MNLSSLFAGAAEKPYTVEDAVSYNELDYLSVSGVHIKSLFLLFCRWLEPLLRHINASLQTPHVVSSSTMS